MNHSPLRQLFVYLKPYHPTIIFASVCSILNQICDIFPEILLGIAVDIVVNKTDSFIARFGFTDIMTQLTILGALTLITWTFESIFQYLYAMTWRNLVQTIQHTLRIEAYSKIQSADISYFEEKNSGELISIINDDVNQLERFLDYGVDSMMQLATSTLLTGAIFLYTSPTIAFFTLAPTPFIIIISFVFQNRLSSLYANVRKQAGLLGGRLSNNIMGILTIKSYATEKYEIKRISEYSKNYKRANRCTIAVSSAFRPVIRMAIVLGFVATIVVGGWYTINEIIPIGAYTTLVFLTQRLLWPFTYLADVVNDYQRGMASVKRILHLINLPITNHSGETILERGNLVGNIEFKNISFGYPNSAVLFDNLSFTIPAKKTVAFVGATGSGKSTLIKLLLRFYTPQKGSILLDNHDLQTLNINSLRESISLVSQEAFLFQGTIYHNIAYGSAHATHTQIITAAKMAQAHSFIMELPDQYETLIGEQAQKLSGGQRQRISIARALLKNAPIFIFDEATSAVDNETQRAIQLSLEQIAHNHTIIIIAHRLSTIRNADIIYVLDKGTIREAGNHTHLIEQQGVYAHLWKMQQE